MNVFYEWIVELTTTKETAEHEADEILDTHGCESYVGARLLATEISEPGVEGQIALVRNDDAGRSWAYLEDGVLPSHFADAYGDDVAKVPKRFVAEVARAS
jgi:hypothetical protein